MVGRRLVARLGPAAAAVAIIMTERCVLLTGQGRTSRQLWQLHHDLSNRQPVLEQNTAGNEFIFLVVGRQQQETNAPEVLGQDVSMQAIVRAVDPANGFQVLARVIGPGNAAAWRRSSW